MFDRINLNETFLLHTQNLCLIEKIFFETFLLRTQNFCLIKKLIFVLVLTFL